MKVDQPTWFCTDVIYLPTRTGAGGRGGRETSRKKKQNPPPRPRPRPRPRPTIPGRGPPLPALGPPPPPHRRPRSPPPLWALSQKAQGTRGRRGAGGPAAAGGAGGNNGLCGDRGAGRSGGPPGRGWARRAGGGRLPGRVEVSRAEGEAGGDRRRPARAPRGMLHRPVVRGCVGRYGAQRLGPGAEPAPECTRRAGKVIATIAWPGAGAGASDGVMLGMIAAPPSTACASSAAGRPAPVIGHSGRVAGSQTRCQGLISMQRAGRRDVSSLHASTAESTSASNGASAPAGLARRILSDPGLEGDPLKFLRVSEAYWTVGTSCLPSP